MLWKPNTHKNNIKFYSQFLLFKPIFYDQSDLGITVIKYGTSILFSSNFGIKR